MKVRYWPAWGEWNLSLPTGIAMVGGAVAAPLLGWTVARERWEILVLLVLVGVLPIVIRWPVIPTFGLYAFLVPFDGVVNLKGGTPTKLAGLVAAAALVAAALMEPRLRRPPTAAIWLTAFILWAFMSAGWTIMDPTDVFQSLQTPLSLFLLYIVAVSVRVSKKELLWVCALFLLGATLAAGWSVLYGVEDAYDPSSSGVLKGRATLKVGGTTANPNAFAAGLILPLALA